MLTFDMRSSTDSLMRENPNLKCGDCGGPMDRPVRQIRQPPQFCSRCLREHDDFGHKELRRIRGYEDGARAVAVLPEPNPLLSRVLLPGTKVCRRCGNDADDHAFLDHAFRPEAP